MGTNGAKSFPGFVGYQKTQQVFPVVKIIAFQNLPKILVLKIKEHSAMEFR